MRYDVIPPNAGLYYDFTSDPFCQKALDRSGRIRNVDKSAYLYGPKWVPIGLEFDGVDDYCEVENNDDADITVATPEKPLTIALVARPMSDLQQYLLSKNSSVSGIQYAVMRSATGKIQFRTTDLGGLFSAGIPVATGEVVNYVVSYDGSNIKEYKNGVLVSTTARIGNLTSRPYINIGCRLESEASRGYYYQGTISELYVGHAQPDVLINWFERTGRYEKYGIAR